MKFLKYLVLCFSFFFSTYSYSSTVYFINYSPYGFSSTSNVYSSIGDLCSAYQNAYNDHNDTYKLTYNTYDSDSCIYTLASGSTIVNAAHRVAYGRTNGCSSNSYADFKGATSSQADGTMCYNGCSVRTSSTSKISDYGSGGTVSIQYFCDVNFKNCSGVVKNTGGTCSGTTSGITFTDRGTAAPTQADCGSYGTYNGQVVCLGAKKSSTATGKATTTSNSTGNSTSATTGTSTTNSNSSTTTTGDGTTGTGTGNSTSATTGTSTTTSNSTTTTTTTNTSTSVTNFEFDDSNIVNAVNDVSNQIKVYGERFDGYFTKIFSDDGKAKIEALGQASNDSRVSSSQSSAQSALQNFANKLSFSNSSCVRDMTINVPRFGSMTFPLSQYCDLLALLRIFLQLMTLFACLRMFDATVRWI